MCEAPQKRHHLFFRNWTFTERLGNIHWTFTEHSLNIHWTFTEHSLNIHWTFTEHSLSIHWTFTSCYRNVLAPEPRNETYSSCVLFPCFVFITFNSFVRVQSRSSVLLWLITLWPVNGIVLHNEEPYWYSMTAASPVPYSTVPVEIRTGISQRVLPAKDKSAHQPR
jgi:hypothetical protein